MLILIEEEEARERIGGWEGLERFIRKQTKLYKGAINKPIEKGQHTILFN